MNKDDRVEIVGDGSNCGDRWIGRTGILDTQEGEAWFVFFDPLAPGEPCGAFFPETSLVPEKQRIDFSRYEDDDLWRAAHALASINAGYTALERLQLTDANGAVDFDVLTAALNRELHLRLQIARAAFGGDLT